MRPSTREASRAANALLTRWFKDEQRIHEGLQRQSTSEQREALGCAATYFKVVRSLRRGPESQHGLLRFELLRRCFAKIDGARISEQKVVTVTRALAKAVAAAYGGKLYLSLASKLLWAKYRDPYIIYDSAVRRVLGAPRGDYSGYVQLWREHYSRHASAIGTACDALASSSSVDPTAKALLTEPWFRHRTFDLYIWLKEE